METIKVNIFRLLCILPIVGGVSSCTDTVAVEDEPIDNSNVICIGGIETEALTINSDEPVHTRASEEPKKDAETVDWLLEPLFKGLDVTYRKSGSDGTPKVAILKLMQNTEGLDYTTSNIKKSDSGLAEYSFNYRTDDKPAQWQGNGYHYFEGVYVPSEIRYNPAQDAQKTTSNASLVDITKAEGSACDLNIDQSKDQSSLMSGYANYTLLEHYLGMPANWGINATIGRIKLPFKHRLARVIAYVLIDPVLEGVKIEGYSYSNDGNGNIIKEDATDSAIRFCNVKVLNGVEEAIDATGHATLTPQWTEARKAIPHFVDERGSVNASGTEMDADHFIMFYKTAEKHYIFPANDESDTKKPWTTANNAWNIEYSKATGTEAQKIKTADEKSGYVRTVYGKVPVYDLIVRPTYTAATTVMYDEYLGSKTKEQFATVSNNIDFEITLDNGLSYQKKFEFDLDANFQTIVYLRINQEAVNYNSSGAEVWTEEGGADGYYGVNNQNGNTLSYAGNSWQRAYRIGTKHNAVTDGHFYDKDAEDKYAQYVDDATWIKMFSEATQDGAHHGDYFILEKDLTISAKSLPDNFIFTGHLDGQGHTITLTDVGEGWIDYVQTTDYSAASPYFTKTGDNYNEVHLPTLYEKTPVPVNYDEEECYTLNTPHLVDYITESGDVIHKTDPGYVPTYPEDYTPITTEDIKEYNDVYTEKTLTLAEVIAAPGVYYTREGDTEPYSYSPYTQALPLYITVSRTSGSSLFGGLNATYMTKQETESSIYNQAWKWEANVHKENNKWVPVAGYRAELLNVKLAEGGKFFPEGAVYTGNDLNKADATVSGYIFNCWEGSTKVENIVPIPQY